MPRLRDLALAGLLSLGALLATGLGPAPARADEVVLVHDHWRRGPPPPRWHRPPPPPRYGYYRPPPPRYYHPPPRYGYYPPPPPPRHYRPPPGVYFQF
ncbi:hypothetical protein [Roseomonas sp. KE0001]|uniref:hypothetical protein n=1 Tax=unclassified Roseomonas TaxID=2617492 RepID=UPI0018DFFBA4|nr:hypothetical protein [Roseomonas sp. KE0001]MBI0433248.1 hypothetical protein [Roseomonas sp. KE0001]